MRRLQQVLKGREIWGDTGEFPQSFRNHSGSHDGTDAVEVAEGAIAVGGGDIGDGTEPCEVQHVEEVYAIQEGDETVPVSSTSRTSFGSREAGEPTEAGEPRGAGEPTKDNEGGAQLEAGILGGETGEAGKKSDDDPSDTGGEQRRSVFDGTGAGLFNELMLAEIGDAGSYERTATSDDDDDDDDDGDYDNDNDGKHKRQGGDRGGGGGGGGGSGTTVDTEEGKKPVTRVRDDTFVTTPSRGHVPTPMAPDSEPPVSSSTSSVRPGRVTKPMTAKDMARLQTGKQSVFQTKEAEEWIFKSLMATTEAHTPGNCRVRVSLRVSVCV